MAYRIHYGHVVQKKSGRPRGRFWLLTLGFFMLFALAAWRLAPGELTALQQLFFPQNQLDTLLQDIQDGDAIADAVAAFCQDIFHGK